MKPILTFTLLLISFFTFSQVPSEKIENIAKGILGNNDAVKIKKEINAYFINPKDLAAEFAKYPKSKLHILQDLIEIYNKIEYSEGTHGIKYLASISMNINSDSLKETYTKINEAIITFNISSKTRNRFVKDEEGKNFRKGLLYLINNEYRPQYFCVIYNYLCFMKAVYKSGHDIEIYKSHKDRAKNLFKERFQQIDISLASIFKSKFDKVIEKHTSNDYHKIIDTMKIWGKIEAKLMNYSSICFSDSICLKILVTENLLQDIEIIHQSLQLYNKISIPAMTDEIAKNIKAHDDKATQAIKIDMYRDTYKPMIKSLIEFGKIIVAVYSIEIHYIDFN